MDTPHIHRPIVAGAGWLLLLAGTLTADELPKAFVDGHGSGFIELGEPTTCNFEYAGWLTEANQLGNVAYRTGKKLEWDPVKLEATNAPEAEPLIKREYRSGWNLV